MVILRNLNIKDVEIHFVSYIISCVFICSFEAFSKMKEKTLNSLGNFNDWTGCLSIKPITGQATH